MHEKPRVTKCGATVEIRGIALREVFPWVYRSDPSFPWDGKILHVAVEMDLSKVHRLKFSKVALSEAEAILSRFIQYHINKELKSKKFLKDLAMESLSETPSLRG